MPGSVLFFPPSLQTASHPIVFRTGKLKLHDTPEAILEAKDDHWLNGPWIPTRLP
jgi:hypothetical protein